MKIENIEQLNIEIKKLEVKSDLLKAQLKLDYEDIKEELKPANILLDSISNISGFKISRDSLFEKGFSIGLRFLLSKILVTAEEGIEEKARAIIEKAMMRISEFAKKIFKKKKKEPEPEEDGNFTGE